jgi:hypothetical protein
MPSIITALKGPIPWGILIAWAVISCLLSGAVAATFNMPSLWGGSNGVLEYMLPLPFSWGMLHYPSLGIFGALLVLASSDPEQWLGIVRRLCLGVFIAALGITVFSDTLRGFPLLMYFSVDAATALLFTALIWGQSPPQRSIAPKLHTRLLLGPSLLALFISFAAPLLMDRYNFAKSDSVDISHQHDVVQFWVYLNRGAGKPEKECTHLQKYAETRKGSYPRSGGLRHRKILLFKNKEAFRTGSQSNPWVTYEWWPDGHAKCSADPDF